MLNKFDPEVFTNIAKKASYTSHWEIIDPTIASHLLETTQLTDNNGNLPHRFVSIAVSTSLLSNPIPLISLLTSRVQFHLVLFKLKPNISPSLLSEFKATASAMVGKVPGLQRIDLGPPHPSTAHRSLGCDMGLVAVLDKPETIKIYAEHPEHQKWVSILCIAFFARRSLKSMFESWSNELLTIR